MSTGLSCFRPGDTLHVILCNPAVNTVFEQQHNPNEIKHALLCFNTMRRPIRNAHQISISTCDFAVLIFMFYLPPVLVSNIKNQMSFKNTNTEKKKKKKKKKKITHKNNNKQKETNKQTYPTTNDHTHVRARTHTKQPD